MICGLDTTSSAEEEDRRQEACPEPVDLEHQTDKPACPDQDGWDS